VRELRVPPGRPGEVQRCAGPLPSQLMAERQGEVPGWLRAVQVFEYLGLAVAALLVITGVAPRLGLVVAVASLLVAVVVQARISSYE
jgi:uncharacterized membrane protein YphA (DoxX/SURF4 family)